MKRRRISNAEKDAPKKSRSGRVKNTEEKNEVATERGPDHSAAEKDGIAPLLPPPAGDGAATVKTNFYTTSNFDSLNLDSRLQAALDNQGWKLMTQVQARAIPLMLQGHDVLGAAPTGSGKTLAFLLPAFQTLLAANFQPRAGTGALVISPTRELAMQIFDVATELNRNLSMRLGLLMGGTNRKDEQHNLERGVVLVVACPGRLLDHLVGTSQWNYKQLALLVIDEADRILDDGFEEQMRAILARLDKATEVAKTVGGTKHRQTALFSATQTTKVQDLVKLSLRQPAVVEVKSQYATVETIDQGFVVCRPECRFGLLYKFLRANKDKKIMAFFSSCKSVEFHETLFKWLDFGNIWAIHGQKKQSCRMRTFYDFGTTERGVLFCTDVAARGLDIPCVDWILQCDLPSEPREYIHRVGRSARGFDGTGKALLLLMPEEIGFVQYLRAASVPVKEMEFKAEKLMKLQKQFEEVVMQNQHISRLARDAYKSYFQAYSSRSLRDVFDVNRLDIYGVARSFGFQSPPAVEIGVKKKQSKKQRRRH